MFSEDRNGLEVTEATADDDGVLFRIGADNGCSYGAVVSRLDSGEPYVDVMREPE